MIQNGDVVRSYNNVTSPYALGRLLPSTAYTVRINATCGNEDGGFATVDFSTSCLEGGDVAIGQNGNEGSTNYVPTYAYYSYCYTQQLILANEMNGPTTVYGIKIKYNSSSDYNRNMTIYVGQTDLNALSTTTVATGLQQVYTGMLSCTPGWNTIMFDTPFEYDGTNNLVIAFDDNTGSWTGGLNFATRSTENTMCVGFYEDYANPDPENISEFTGYNYAVNYRNDMVLVTPCNNDVPGVAPMVTVEDFDQTTVELAWIPGYHDTVWNVDYRLAGDTVWTSAALGVTELGYTVEGLNEHTAYDFRVSHVVTLPDTTELYATVVSATTFHCADSAVFVAGDEVNYSTWRVVPPVYTAARYSISQTLYDPEAFNGEQMLTAIGYYYDNVAEANRPNVDIYMVATDKQSFEGDNDMVDIDESFVKVYSGAMNFTTGWNLFDFNQATQFPYDGESNILVTVVDHSNVLGAVSNFRGFSATTNRAIMAFSDENDYTEGSFADYEAEMMQASNVYANAQFYSCGIYCGAPAVTRVDVDRNKGMLNWHGLGSEYEIEYYEPLLDTTHHILTFSDEDEDAIDHQLLLTDLAYSVEETATEQGYATEYKVRVRKVCQDNFNNEEVNSEWSGWFPFTTPIPCPQLQRIYVLQRGYKNATIGWQINSNSGDFELEFAVHPEVADTTGFDWESLDWNILQTTSNALPLNGSLTPGTHYIVRVRQWCDRENDIFSFWKYIDFTTKSCTDISGLTLDTDNLTYTSATFNWTDDANMGNYEVRLIGDVYRFNSYLSYGYNIDDVIRWNSYQMDNATTPSYTFSGLNQNTTYRVAVREICDTYYGVYSEWMLSEPFTTPLCHAVENLRNDSVSYTIARIAWTDNLNPAGNYQVVMSYNADSVRHVVEYDGEYVEFLDTVGVYPAICTGYRDITVYDTTWTETYMPDGTPVRYPVVTERTETISYEYDCTYYDVQSRIEWVDSLYTNEYNVTDYYVVENAYTTNDTRILFTGLEPGKTYYVRVRNACDEANDVFSAWRYTNFTTPTCNGATGIEMGNINQTYASVSWDAYAPAYELCVMSDQEVDEVYWNYGYFGPEVLNFNVTVETNNYMIENLEPSTLYYVFVRPVCDTAHGVRNNYDFVWGQNYIYFQTALCKPATNLAEVSHGFTTATIQWHETNYERVDVMYRVAGTNAEPEVRTTSNSNIYSISGLEPNTTYEVWLHTYCSIDPENVIDGGECEPITIITNSCDALTGLAVVEDNIDYTTASITWNANQSGEYDVRLRLAEEETWMLTQRVDTVGFDFTGLTNGTAYVADVRHVCPDMIADEYSAWVSVNFTTTTCPVITNLAISGIDYRSAVATWNGEEGAIYEYTYTDNATEEVHGPYIWTGTTLNINQLDAATEYTFTVRNKCADGIYSLPVSVVFTTLECSAPTELAASNMTFSTAHVAWNANPGTSDLRYRTVEVLEDTIYGDYEYVNAITGNATDLAHLNHGTTYEVSVRQNCANTANASSYTSQSEWCVPVEFTTLECTEMSPVTATATHNTITLTWNANENINLYAVNYTVRRDMNLHPAEIITDTTYTIEGLLAGDEVEWMVAKLCDTAEGYSNIFEGVTSTLPCTEVADFRVDSVSNTSALLSWTGNSPRYQVKVRNGNTTIWVDTFFTTETSYMLTGLERGTPYYAAVRGVCDDSAFRTSEWSDQVIFTTIGCLPVEALMVSNVTYTGATVSWSDEGEQGTFQVTYRRSDNTTWSDAINVDSNSYEFTGLTAGTTYVVKVRKACGSTFSTWSEMAQFTTPTCGNVTNLAHTNVSYTTATLAWDGTATNFQLQYRAMGESEWNNIDVIGLTYTLEDLEQNTSYEVQVRQNCFDNIYSGWSASDFFTTSSCAVVTDIEASNIALASATISWTGSATSYAVRYREIGASNWTSATASTNSIALTDLAQGTSYEVQVQATCAEGVNSAWSGSAIFTTTSCERVLYVSVPNVSFTSATVMWQGTASSYELRYRALNGATWTNIEDLTDTTNVITGLAAATTYEVQVRQYCSIGVASDWSNSVIFATSSCGRISNLAATNVTLTGATLTWTGSGLSYNVQYKALDATNWTDATSQTNSISLSGLAASTSYEVRVQQVCGAGLTSDWSSSIFFTTLACSNISDLYVTSLGITEATIAWVGSASSYEIEYKEVNSTWSNNANTIQNTSHTLTGLNRGTSYSVRVRAVCEGNNYSDWTVINFTTNDCHMVNSVMVSAVSYTTATVSWTFSGAQPTGFVVEWNADGTSTTYTQQVAGTESHLDLTNLNINTTYYVSVKALCGTNVESDPVTRQFTTLSCANVANVVATGITRNSATIMWNGTADLYVIGYRPVNGAQFIDTIVSSNIFTIEGLMPSTDYDVRVRTLCGSLESDWAFTTFTTEGCREVTGLFVTNTTLTTATIMWSGFGTLYDVQYRAQGGQWSDIATMGGTYTTLTGLTPGTTYEVHVRNNCGEGLVSDWCTSVEFTTASCQAPVILGVNNVTINSAFINWISMNNGGDNRYELSYRTFNGSWSNEITVDATNYQLDGLTHDTYYEVRVRQVCVAGSYSDWSAPVSFTTLHNVGIDDVETEEELTISVSIYPNPATTEATVAYTGFTGKVEILLVDMNGRVIARENTTCTGDCEHQLNVNGLAAGSYFVRINGESASQVKKLIVK